MSAHTLALFALAAFVLIATPGAGLVFLVTQTIERGRAAGVASALGIETADLVHMLAAVLGVSALLAASDLAYDTLKYAGAAYLIGLGIYKLLLERPGPNRPQPRAAHHRLYAQGFLVQILNPKPALFFAAFLPQFIDSGSPLAQQLAMLVAVYVTIAIACDISYVLLAGILGRRLKSAGHSRIVSRVSGATYVALGAVAALAGSRPAKALV